MDTVDTFSLDTSTKADSFLNDLDDDQLYQLVEETIHANEVLEAETIMFEKHLFRVESKGVRPELSHPTAGHGGSIKDAYVRKRSKSHSSGSDRLHKLTAEQKCEIALKEIEELRLGIIALDDESEKVLDNYRALMEEAEIHLIELKKEKYEFERDILRGAINPRTKKIIAERCLRFFDDKIKARDALIEKLRLKNSTLKVQMKKLKLQLKQKEEMGEVLNEVDFNQLKIENQQYLEKIDERNQDLLRLKLMAGNTLQVLNSYKKKLHTLTKESKKLQGEIQLRQDLQGKIEAETKLVEMDRAKAQKINKQLRKNLTDFRVPDVMEYVLGKAEIYDLQKKIKNWERKVDIAELALRTHRKAWNVVQMHIQEKERWRDMVGV